MPPCERIGNHGFTGQNYISTPNSNIDVQFVCEASVLNGETEHLLEYNPTSDVKRGHADLP